MAERFANKQPVEMRDQMEKRIGRWTADFRVEESLAGART